MDAVTMILESSGIGYDIPTEEEYNQASYLIDNAKSLTEYNYYKDIIDRYERAEELYWQISKLSDEHQRQGKSRNSYYIMTNGKIVGINNHNSVSEINDGLTISEMLKMGNIRLIGGMNEETIMLEISKLPTEQQRQTLWRLISSCQNSVYVDKTTDRRVINSMTFDRNKMSAELIFNKIIQMFN